MIWELLIPGLLLVVSCAAMAGRRDAYSLLVTGAEEGLQTVIHILPALVILLTSVSMLRASGAMDWLT